MAFATTNDVSDRLGRDLNAGEEQSVTLLLDGATAVIADAVDRDDAWATALNPVPQIVRFMTIELACRALANPNSLRSLQETLGQHSSSVSFRDSAGLFLTDVEERLVRRAVYGNDSGSARVEGLVEEVYDLYYGS